MIKKHLIYLLIFGFVLSMAGCSRRDETQPDAATDNSALQPAEVVSVPVAEIAQEVAEESLANPDKLVVTKSAIKPVAVPVVMDVKDLPFRLCAIMSGDSRGPKAGLVAWKNDAYAIVSAGSSFLGYKIEKIDYTEESITFSLDGFRMVVKLAGDDSIVERAVAVTAKVADYPGTNTIEMIKAPLFEALPEEEVAGIDPNDFETWPANYQGPAIERLLKSNRADGTYRLGEIEIPENMMPSGMNQLQFKPTNDEISRGIDPNNAATWPKDYRGPGIERAFGNE